MWPELPLEFYVVGTPVSLQSSNTRAKEEWKRLVLAAAESEIDGGSWAFYDVRLSITLFYFPQAQMQGDIDNIAKLTIDALKPRIYVDDSLVDRVLIQRFYPDQDVAFAKPSGMLLSALSEQDPVLFIKLDELSQDEITA